MPERKPQVTTKQCICCGRKLSAALKHVETVLGPVGPECAKKADITAAVDRLYAYDLGELAGGEIRLDGVATATGFTFPSAVFEALEAQASACGVRLTYTLDAPRRQFVVKLKGGSVSDLLAKVGTMLPLSNPVTGLVRVPVAVGA